MSYRSSHTGMLLHGAGVVFPWTSGCVRPPAAPHKYPRPGSRAINTKEEYHDRTTTNEQDVIAPGAMASGACTATGLTPAKQSQVRQQTFLREKGGVTKTQKREACTARRSYTKRSGSSASKATPRSVFSTTRTLPMPLSRQKKSPRGF